MNERVSTSIRLPKGLIAEVKALCPTVKVSALIEEALWLAVVKAVDGLEEGDVRYFLQNPELYTKFSQDSDTSWRQA